MKNSINISQFIKVVIFLCVIIVFTRHSLHAQITDPSTIDPDSNAPIDGGLSLLIAAGAGYGVKKIREMRNKDK